LLVRIAGVRFEMGMGGLAGSPVRIDARDEASDRMHVDA
jgi:hypothetical protein